MHLLDMPLLYAHESTLSRKPLLSIGSIYEEMKKPEEALQAYRQVFGRFPDTAVSQEAHKDILRLSKRSSWG